MYPKLEFEWKKLHITSAKRLGSFFFFFIDSNNMFHDKLNFNHSLFTTDMCTQKSIINMSITLHNVVEVKNIYIFKE